MPTFLVRSLRPVFSLLITLSLSSAPIVHAQGEEPVPINIGENKIGEVTEANPTSEYVVTVFTPQLIDLQVLAVTQGFAPALRVFDSSGIMVWTATNANLETAVRLASLEVSPGLYRVEVSSANGRPGQFVIGAQSGEALPAPVPLALGQEVASDASSEAERQRYAFAGSQTDVMLLNVNSSNPSAAPVVILKDADSLETLAITSARVVGVRYRIPAGALNYLVEVTNSGASASEPYSICLENENGSGPVCPAGTASAAEATPTLIAFAPSPTATPPPLPPLPSTGACVVASRTGGAVNVRSGPSTDYAVLLQLSGNMLAAVTGRLPDGSWYEVNVNGVTGWISASVTRTGGQCSGVPVVVSPTPSPSATASTATPTEPWTATPTLTQTPPVVATLNFSLPPVYGSTSLTSGFVPDPFSVGITSGGPANVSYLGGGCSGYTTSAPSFSVNYTAGAFPLLRFYFIGGSDTTMVINTPGGSYVCVDDSFGTLNPTIDFNSPSSGRYDIWVGSFAQGAPVPGTLYVTESTGNHP